MNNPTHILNVLFLKQSNAIRQATKDYPRQFWLLFWGMLINSLGSSMVWPFLSIHMRRQLGLPLTTIMMLFALNSAVGLVSISIAGPVIDRFGRKGVMVLSLLANSVGWAMMSTADTLELWALLMAVGGAFGQLYRVGGDAMVADMIEPERRAGAYALIRMVQNLGVAIGPSIGGFITASSYALAFYIGAGAQAAFALLLLFLAAETVPQRILAAEADTRASAGYGQVLRDWTFLTFCTIYTLAGMAYSLMMILLPVYVKESFGVPESQYGFIMATNATMVVLLQFSITRITQRYHYLPVLVVGSLFYALGAGSVAWGWSFPTFLASMIVLTIGEMIMIPTLTALTANLAPPDMRGRYMSIYSLTWGIAFGIGPVLGGILNDNLAPVAIWHGGLVIGLAAALGFALMAKALRARELSPSHG